MAATTPSAASPVCASSLVICLDKRDTSTVNVWRSRWRRSSPAAAPGLSTAPELFLPRVSHAHGWLALGGACSHHDELLGTLLGDSGATVDMSVPLATPPSFEAPTLVAALSDVDSIDEDPTFTGDLLELYFMSTRAGTKDIWRSQRATADAPWGAPAAVAELNSSNDEWCPGISLDGLTLWFATDRAAGRGQLWQATRAARRTPGAAPAAVTELGGNGVDFAPVVDATETMLFFSSDRASLSGATEGTNYDLYWSSAPERQQPWGAPQAVPRRQQRERRIRSVRRPGSLVIFFTSV